MEFELIPKERAEKLRERFITEFVDTASGNYRNYYDESDEYVRHFLWDSLRDYSFEKHCCTQEQAAEFIEQFDRVYFMWDTWREGTVFADEYPNAVIETSGGELGRGLPLTSGTPRSKLKSTTATSSTRSSPATYTFSTTAFHGTWCLRTNPMTATALTILYGFA